MSQVLQRPTLILNRNWQPIHVSTVARALVLLYTNAACVVDPQDYQTYDWDDWSRMRPASDALKVRSVSQDFRVPEVITLVHFGDQPRIAVAFSRRNLFRRDHFTCQYCGVQPGSKELTIDHILPRSRGGVTSWENCALACVSCNAKKADRTPSEAGMRLRRVPTKPRWSPYFATNRSYLASWSKFLSDAYWNVELSES